MRQSLEAAFGYVELDWNQHGEIDPLYYRSAEVDSLLGGYSEAKRQLAWEPKTWFLDLLKLMVNTDVDPLRRHRAGQIKVSS